MVKILRYNQTKLNILHQIAELELEVGEMLPSERSMAAKLGISMGTLRRALAELESQEIIKKQHGRGSILKKSIKQGSERSRLALIHIKRVEQNKLLSSLDELEAYLNERAIDLDYVPVTSFDKNIITAVEKCFGVIVTGWLDQDWIRNLQLLNKPMVAIGSHQYSAELPLISYDWKGASSLLTRELIGQGQKHIGLLNGGHRYYPSSLIYEGYVNELSQAGLKCNDNWIKWVCIDDNSDVIKDFIINQLPALDAVVMELGCYLPFLSLCWEMGINPDKKLGLVGCYENNIRINSSGNNILLTSFEKDAFIVGAELFLKSLQHETKVTEETLIKARLL
jgi:DNA-binding transcriptional regulator YhcF (GntR family)